jgi:single-stranded DNA-binding protein
LHAWEDKNTKQKQSKLRVDVETFKFVGPANHGAGEGGAPAAPRAPRPAAASAPASEPVEGDAPPESDDVPF